MRLKFTLEFGFSSACSFGVACLCEVLGSHCLLFAFACLRHIYLLRTNCDGITNVEVHVV